MKYKKEKLNKEDRMENVFLFWMPDSVCSSYVLRFYGCVFCSISLLFAYMCMRRTSSPRSIGGVPLGRDLLLRTTFTSMRSCCNWRASGVAAIQTTRGKQIEDRWSPSKFPSLQTALEWV